MNAAITPSHPNRTVENVSVGLVLANSSCLALWPYFSWPAAAQRSPRPIATSRTANPCSFLPSESAWGSFSLWFKVCGRIGLWVPFLFGLSTSSRLAALFDVLASTGGPRQGFPTSHFIPHPRSAPGSRELFPSRWKGLVQMSNIRLVCGVFAQVFLGPCKRRCCGWLLACNGVALPGDQMLGWFAYTWLQHTDNRHSHFKRLTMELRGEGPCRPLTVPNGPLLNFPGTTVIAPPTWAHHLSSRNSHYHAWRGHWN